jgi:HD superfamily phosphodiesterase
MKHYRVARLVESAYVSSKEDFAQWSWQNHVQFVAKNAEKLSKEFGANEDLAVAGAWLHDFGDVFIDRHAQGFEEVSKAETIKVLKESGYSSEEIQEVLAVIIEPHSCRGENLPRTIEGKVLATADALAHLNTDFYIQFAWKHIPAGKAYREFIEWVNEKIERDFNKRIFFGEVKAGAEDRYKSLKEVFGKTSYV